LILGGVAERFEVTRKVTRGFIDDRGIVTCRKSGGEEKRVE
jgi:hypothetical protein